MRSFPALCATNLPLSQKCKPTFEFQSSQLQVRVQQGGNDRLESMDIEQNNRNNIPPCHLLFDNYSFSDLTKAPTYVLHPRIGLASVEFHVCFLRRGPPQETQQLDITP